MPRWMEKADCGCVALMLSGGGPGLSSWETYGICREIKVQIIRQSRLGNIHIFSFESTLTTIYELC